jgi:hypothetical protein
VQTPHATKRRSSTSGLNLLAPADGFARKKPKSSVATAAPALSDFHAISAFELSSTGCQAAGTPAAPSNSRVIPKHISEDSRRTVLGAPKFIIPGVQAAPANYPPPDKDIHSRTSILKKVPVPGFPHPPETPTRRHEDHLSSHSSTLSRTPRNSVPPLLEKRGHIPVTPRTPQNLRGIRTPAMATPGSSSKPPSKLKSLKPPILTPSTPNTPMRSIAPPKLAPPSSHRKLKTPSTLNIARAMDPSSVDGAALLLSLALEQTGGTDYVPPSQRPIVAGLGPSPRKPGEKAPLVKGGMAEMAKKALSRVRQSHTLWGAERHALERNRRTSTGEPPEIRVRVRSVVHVAKGKGGFASLDPPPRAVLLRAVVERVYRTTNTKGMSIRSHDEVFVLLRLGPNGTAAGVSADDCLQDLHKRHSRVDIWPPWTEVSTSLYIKEEEDTGPAHPIVPLGRRLAELPLPSPLDGARQSTQDMDEPKGDPVRTVFCERFVVVLDD